jgi:hypothetical protein
MGRGEAVVTMATVMEMLLAESTVRAPDLRLRELVELREQVCAEGDELMARWRPALKRRAFLPSAVNLARYIAPRRRDLRGLQEALMPLRLSSLARGDDRRGHGGARRVRDAEQGPYVLDAVAILDDVLGRMEAHQSKKTSRLRALRAW